MQKFSGLVNDGVEYDAAKGVGFKIMFGVTGHEVDDQAFAGGFDPSGTVLHIGDFIGGVGVFQAQQQGARAGVDVVEINFRRLQA